MLSVLPAFPLPGLPGLTSGPRRPQKLQVGLTSRLESEKRARRRGPGEGERRHGPGKLAHRLWPWDGHTLVYLLIFPVHKLSKVSEEQVRVQPTLQRLISRLLPHQVALGEERKANHAPGQVAATGGS